jgi:hypothetical protein
VNVFNPVRHGRAGDEVRCNVVAPAEDDELDNVHIQSEGMLNRGLCIRHQILVWSA